MRTVNLALMGAGTVGSAVYKLITENPSRFDRFGIKFNFVGVAVRDTSKVREIPTHLLTTDLTGLATEPSVDIVVKVMGGEHPAYDVTTQAMLAGKHIATANKKLIACHGQNLFAIAKDSGVMLRCEASVAAGIPIVQCLGGVLSSNHVRSIEGIINGTTNFMLAKMAEGQTYGEALQEAQALGFAEADPSSDVEGWDATYKLTILSALAWGEWLNPDSIERQGITRLESASIQKAIEAGNVIKLVARAEYTSEGIKASVKPEFLPNDHQLSKINGSTNAVILSADPVGTIKMTGPGAGGGPTAASVVGDCLEIAKTITA